jgi:geranylgeranyl pyrophosphate synthase
MRQSLGSEPGSDSSSDDRISRLFYVPKICYQAAGGNQLWSHDLGSAWLLFYFAAHLMDNVEDQDTPDPFLASYPSGVRVNVASGLFFTAANSLNNLHRENISQTAANEIIEDFYSSFLSMCSGQNEDLLNENIDLATYWRIAATKSGSFFGMGCWAGGRLAIDNPIRLEGFRQFGHNLGIFKQIRDDLEEMRVLFTQNPLGDPTKLRRTLPIIYAFEVLPQAERNRIDQYLGSLNPSPEATQPDMAGLDTAHQDATQDLEQILDRAGAELYVATELERYRNRALAALEQAAPSSEGKEILVSLL